MIFRKLGLGEKAMSEYLAILQQLHLPHLLILAGAVLVLVGAVGIVLRPSREIGPDEAREVTPERQDPPPGTTASEFAQAKSAQSGDGRTNHHRTRN